MKLEKIGNYKKIIIGGLIVVGVIAALILTTSKAKYKNIETMDLVNGTINYKPYDFKVIAMYKNDGDGDVEIDKMPLSGYAINESKSYCYTTNNDEHSTGIKLFTNDLGQHIIEGLNKNDKCYLYFYKENESKIIDKIKGQSKGIKTSFSDIAKINDTGIYEAPDEFGKSYYFRGLEENLNNWVKFAGFYWRIIRINGNGTVRMIYQGEANGAVSSSNKTGTTTQIGKTYYNSERSSNRFVGYMYGSSQDTYNNTHSNDIDSNIKKVLIIGMKRIY